ncbi:MAG: hypothetical protein IPN44_14165 [Flavobacteriales bacterium]|nr:hypothetical protein [Flavobacteriales bacterium]
MKLFCLLLLPACLALAAPSYAQSGLRDTSIAMVPITLSYAYQAPGGSLADRFGNNHNIGLSAARKFKSNYLLGLEGSFMFGNQVVDRNVLKELVSTNGVIVDQDGNPAAILLYERGYTIFAVAGKLIPVAGPNPNSGMLLKVGGGYMRHKLLIESQNNVVPALEGEYAKGYDRLTAGPAALLFVGYQHLSNNRRVNFLVGFEMQLGFTQSLRPYNFDTGRPGDTGRLDFLNGLRAGWTLPIYKARDDRQFYR